jgi:hypothetical protein
MVASVTAVVVPGVDAFLEGAALGQPRIRRLALMDAEVALAAGAAELAAHHLEALGPVLRAIGHALGVVADDALGHHLALGIGVGALQHIADLVEIVLVPRGGPAAAAGAPDIDRVVVRRAGLSHQQELLGQHAVAHRADIAGLRPLNLANAHPILPRRGAPHAATFRLPPSRWRPAGGASALPAAR